MIASWFLLALTTNGIFQGLSLHSSFINLVYEPPILYGLMIVILFWLWAFMHILKKREWVLSRSTLLVVGSLLIFISYALSALFSPSDYMTKQGIWHGFIIISVFLAGSVMNDYRRLVENFPKIYMIAGYILVLYGYLNLFGNAYMKDSLSINEGIRISSIFQYPNAYAVLLLTLWILQIVELAHSKKRWARLLHGAMLVPVVLSFLLTLSRGAIVILPVIAIVTLLMFVMRVQIKMIIHSVVAVIVSLLLYGTMQRAGEQTFQAIQQALTSQSAYKTTSIFSGDVFAYWLMLVAASALVSAWAYYSERWLNPLYNRLDLKLSAQWTKWVLPVGVLVFTFIGFAAVASPNIGKVLPEVLRQRIGSIDLETHSVYERLTMYKDALSIWRESPLFGSGKGAWEAYYNQYQSYSYLSAQPHSYLFQLLIEVGLVGLLVIVGLILTTLVMYLRVRKREPERVKHHLFYAIVPSTILLHSLIDFEMSYLFYVWIVFFCIGVLSGSLKQRIAFQWSVKRVRALKWAMVIGVLIVGIVVIVGAGRQIYALEQYKEADRILAAQRPFNLAEDRLEAALSASPGHPVLLHQLIALNLQVYDQTADQRYLGEASKYAEKLNKHEPRYREAIELNFHLAMRNQQPEKAVQLIIEKVDQHPFDSALYDLAANELIKQFNTAESNKNTDKSQQLAVEIERLYNRMQKQEEVTLTLPPTVIVNQPFRITEAVRAAYETTKHVLN